MKTKLLSICILLLFPLFCYSQDLDFFKKYTVINFTLDTEKVLVKGRLYEEGDPAYIIMTSTTKEQNIYTTYITDSSYKVLYKLRHKNPQSEGDNLYWKNLDNPDYALAMFEDDGERTMMYTNLSEGNKLKNCIFVGKVNLLLTAIQYKFLVSNSTNIHNK